MAWTFNPASWTNGVTVPHVADFQAMAADLHTWGGNVDAGGNQLVNLHGLASPDPYTTTSTTANYVSLACGLNGASAIAQRYLGNATLGVTYCAGFASIVPATSHGTENGALLATVQSLSDWSLGSGTIAVAGTFYALAGVQGANLGAINPVMSDLGYGASGHGVLMSNEFDVNINNVNTFVQAITFSGACTTNPTSNSCWMRMYSLDAFSLNPTHMMPYGLDLAAGAASVAIQIGQTRITSPATNQNSMPLRFLAYTSSSTQPSADMFVDYGGTLNLHSTGGALYSGGLYHSVDGSLLLAQAGGTLAVKVTSNGTSYFNGGNVVIGGTAATAPLQVVGLVTYASDSAAGTGGLTAGALYKDSSGGVHVKL